MKRFNKIGLFTLLAVISFNLNARDFTLKTQPDPDSTIGEKQEFSKNYNKTFNINANILVILSNKYGKINVKTGGTNQATVNVTIKAKANSQSDADKIFDRINIAFSDGPDYVKAETDIEAQSSWWSWGNNSSDFSIDYDVTMPAANKLDLSNKYGNSYVGQLNSWVKIDQKYGDFRLDGAASSTVNLAYGGGTIEHLAALTATVSYGKLSSTDIKDMALKSKYSAFKFSKVENLALTSAYDDFNIGDVTNFSVDSKYGDVVVGNVDNLAVTSAYTDFKIRKIENSAAFQTSYGDVKIDGVKNGFDAIDIKGSYTDFIIKIDPSVSYQLDVATSYGDINQPASLNTRISKEKGSTKEIVGFVGNQSTKSLIKAKLTYGDLIIK
jgi:hypothetical protein